MKSFIVILLCFTVSVYCTVQCSVCEGVVAFCRTELEINEITNPAQALAKLQQLCEEGYFPFLDPSECSLFLQHFGTDLVNDLLNNTLSDCDICINFDYCATSKDCDFTQPQQRCVHIAVDMLENRLLSKAKFRNYVQMKCAKKPDDIGIPI